VKGDSLASRSTAAKRLSTRHSQALQQEETRALRLQVLVLSVRELTRILVRHDAHKSIKFINQVASRSHSLSIIEYS